MNAKQVRNRVRRALLVESPENDDALGRLRVQLGARAFAHQLVLRDTDTREQFVVTVTKARHQREGTE